jgi:hypothetical protein
MVVKVEVYSDGEQWCARGISADIFTCAPTLDDLVAGVKEAAACHFEEELKGGRALSILLLAEAEVSNVAEVAAG